jgi:hypothetical protein
MSCTGDAMLIPSGGPLDDPRVFSSLGMACVLLGRAYDAAALRGELIPLDTNCGVAFLAAQAIKIAREEVGA